MTQKSTRTLTVSAQGDPWKRTERPHIRFGGRWLREAGFEPGDQYLIEVGQGILTIKRKAVSDD